MARKNRVSVPNGYYHVTTRIVNKEFWLSDPTLKNEIVSRMYGIADFSGINLIDWCIMDNHLHLYIHVPPVPERYWTTPSNEPDAYAYGMRPTECRQPLWSPPEATNNPPPKYQNRPPTGFMMSDEEMLSRLLALYGFNRKYVDGIRDFWIELRSKGNDAAVDEIKDRYCRRMYNLSQFVKTLKENIVRLIKATKPQVGHVFESRFHSGLVEKDDAVSRLVSLYIDFNPARAGMVSEGQYYRWSSLGEAMNGGKHCKTCRAAYEQLYGRPWKEVAQIIQNTFRERQKASKSSSSATPAEQVQKQRQLPTLMQSRIPEISRGAFIGRSLDFGRDSLAQLGQHFPHPSLKSLKWLCEHINWEQISQAA